MQITIVQAEIELAIQNHILSQIKVCEGTEINIELSATRGPDGYTAIIDILPPGMTRPSRTVGKLTPLSRNTPIAPTPQPLQPPAEDQQLVEAETAQVHFEPRKLFENLRKPA